MMPAVLAAFNQKAIALASTTRQSLSRLTEKLARPALAALGASAIGWVIYHPPRLDDLLDASLAIRLHVLAAVLALGIGLALLAGVKGTGLHRRLGWTWVIAMAIVAASTLFIQEINAGGFSPIHGLSAWVLISLPFAVVAARKRNIRAHSRAMTGMFVGGLIIAGLFTFLPGRLMYQVFVG